MANKKRRKEKYIFKSGDDWNINILQDIEKHCAEIAFEELNLDIYQNQIEIINYEQMLDIYASNGLPIMYNHWSFGKRFYQNEIMYKKNIQGLAYEIVINSDPCITYLMETNNATLQLITIAHASFGHNHFFKNNYLFKEWTNAKGIIDYLIFAKKYINNCEEKYGQENVEKILDACHSIGLYGITKYKKPKKLNYAEEMIKLKEREENARKRVSDFWDRLIDKKKIDETKKDEEEECIYPEEENLLYFIEKNSPILETWQKEILRIVRKINHYFYPQMQTKVMNEGWASFVHNYIINRMYDKGLIDEGTILEYLKINTNILYWMYFSEFGFGSKFNPYSLGFAIYDEIKRMCENPTSEDESMYPDICGSNWKDTLLNVVKSFRDESFILQFLTPNLIRKHRMFSVYDDENLKHLIVNKIHNENGYNEIRKNLSQMFDFNLLVPEIYIEKVDFKGDRTLYLKHIRSKNMTLDKNTLKVLQKIKSLWGFKVVLNSVYADDNSKIITYSTD